jgi:hypothetical protein
MPGGHFKNKSRPGESQDSGKAKCNFQTPHYSRVVFCSFAQASGRMDVFRNKKANIVKELRISVEDTGNSLLIISQIIQFAGSTKERMRIQ